MDYKALAEAYPNLIPTAKAAELMEMHPNLLRERIKKGLYPFAEDCGDGVRPNIKIYTDRFIAVSYTHLDVYKRQVVRITW